MSELEDLIPSTPHAVWIATALLHQENPKREAFKTDEIFKKVKELWDLPVADETIIMHISSHCVANSRANPDLHRKLYRADIGLYRLYRRGDPYHHSREDGKITPSPASIPSKFLNLLDWYEKEYCDKKSKEFLDVTDDQIIPEFVRIKDGKIELPSNVRNKLRLWERDFVAIIEHTPNTMIIKRADIKPRL